MSVHLSAVELVKAPKGLMDPFESSLVTEDSYYIFDRNKRRCGMLLGLFKKDVLARTSDSSRYPYGSRTIALYGTGHSLLIS
jgi:hypothetical protein